MNSINKLVLCISTFFLVSYSTPAAPVSSTTAAPDTATKPNIVFILLDDLGFVDTSYYADVNSEFYGTSPILDQLSVAGVKFDYHYSEPSCSPSRAALLSGRYSYRNGIDQALVPLTNKALNTNYPILPEVLKSNGYNTFMSGKWHLGSNNNNEVPPGRGFDESIYYLNGNVEPFTRMFGIGFGFTYQAAWPVLLADPSVPVSTKQQIQQLMDPNGYRSSLFHDLSKNYDYKYKMNTLPEYIDDTFQNEALNYLENYDSADPFFMYIPFQSPHSPIVDPCASPYPTVLPAPCDSAVKFAECEKVTDTGRKNLCRMIADSAEKIDEIINLLKAKNVYDNTVVIIVSDNGAQNNFLGDFGSNALAYGQNLPFRGAKVSAFEGGIRTPAIMTGGFVENNYPDLVNCEYSGLIYIADWYNIILNGFAGIDTSNLDLDSINLLPHIEKKCMQYQDVDDDEDNGPKPEERKEIISFRYCDPDKFGENGGIQAGYVRNKKYKLVINGSYSADCGAGSGNPLAQIFTRQGLYLKFDGSGTQIPDEESYKNSQMYNNNKKLFKSKCYDKHLKNPNKNPIDSIQKEFMLFDIKNDKIEACDIADQEQDIVDEMYQKILDQIQYGEFTGTQLFDVDAVPMAALYGIYKDYQCPKAQMRPWDEVYTNNGSPDTQTIINDVFTKISTCPLHPFQPSAAP